jgi:hypothetical protein
MADGLAFQRRQYAFAAHIRDPAQQPAPGDVDERRMKIYRDLLYNNVEGFIANGFPVLRAISSDAVWHARVRDFFADHRCHTPYFLEIAREFLDFLERERGAHPDDPPFIRELCHYEWVELALNVADDEADRRDVDRNGDLLEAVPVLSNLAWALAYQWPVHRIGPDFQPTTPPPQPTLLLVYRDRQDKVGFLEINPVTYRLIELLAADRARTGRQILEQIAAELSHPNPKTVIDAGATILNDLRQREIVIGTRTRTPSTG